MTITGAGTSAEPNPVDPWAYDPTATVRAAPSGLSRFIDLPGGRNYKYDPATRQLGQMGRNLQRVYLAIGTELGSSSTQPTTLGIKMPRKIGNGFPRQVEQAVRDALRIETDIDKVITVDRVDVESGGSRAKTTVTFTDLDTGVQDTATGTP